MLGDLETALNAAQYAAATHTDGPLLVLAGAGSGKTRVLTYRIAHLIRSANVAPSSVLAVTFTNKAAREMRERVALLLGQQEGQGPLLSTFHSFCARLLRQHCEPAGLPRTFTILDEEDRRKVIARVLEQRGEGASAGRIRDLAATIDDAKNKGISPSQSFDQAIGAEAEEAAEIYLAYDQLLRRSGCVDFGDLIVLSVKLLSDHDDVRSACHERWSHLMVDEFQDTNPVQYELLKLLTGAARHLAVVGDDDQSIYRWRGATVANILDFESDFPEAQVVKLEQNYRSTQRILDAAGAVIVGVARRRDKTLWTAAGSGPPITAFVGRDAREEAAWVVRRITQLLAKGISASECAVFFRTNAQARLFEDQLRAAGLPYRLVGTVSFYGRREIKDVLAYLKVLVNPRDDIDFLRIVNTPSRGIGKKTRAALVDMVGDKRATHLRHACSIAAYGGVVGPQPTRALVDFHTMIRDLEQAAQTLTPSELVQEVLEQTGYLDWLDRDDPASAADRRENLDELVALFMELETAQPGVELTDVLENAALVPQNELAPEAHDDPITLMTVHSAKGLEFEAVFVTGLEDELFPMRRDGDDPEVLDEERRLCYVAITRARRFLHLTSAMKRRVFVSGTSESERRPSPFLRDIPSELVEVAAESASPELSWGDTSGISRRARALQRRQRYRERMELLSQGFGAPEDDFAGWSADHVHDFGDTAGFADHFSSEGGSAPDTDSASTGSPVTQDGLAVGATVSHSRFGIGTVVAVAGDGKRATVRVEFHGRGTTESVQARFLKLH